MVILDSNTKKRKKSFWPTFWSKVGAVGIRTKIMGIVALCIICSAIAMVWYTQHDMSAALRSELQEGGLAIGTGLAAQGRDLILTHNDFALYTLVRETQDADDDLIYIFVLDAEDNVLVHTFDGGFPRDLLGVNDVQPEEAFHIQALQTEDDTIQDIAVPVLGGKAGMIRLGMSESAIDAAVAGNIRNMLLWFTLILVLGLSVAYGLASILTVPITRLAQAARAVGKGDFRWKAPVWAKDEIGSLGTAFNEMSKDLERKGKMQARLLAKVINAQEEERKRIARELHDETSQALTSLMVGLRYIEDSADITSVKKEVIALRKLAAQTLDEVHRLATELRPSVLDDLGLVEAVEKYTREFSTKMNINVDTHVGLIRGVRLPSDIEVTVYRIVQEALTNVAKYARAENVSVILRYRDSSLVAVIEDDGIGFDVNGILTSQNKEKLGLFGMYERASIIGGRLSIESQLGSGTTIYLEVPVKSLEEVKDGKDKVASGR
jgi:signal transduction histidine kinase